MFYSQVKTDIDDTGSITRTVLQMFTGQQQKILLIDYLVSQSINDTKTEPRVNSTNENEKRQWSPSFYRSRRVGSHSLIIRQQSYWLNLFTNSVPLTSWSVRRGRRVKRRQVGGKVIKMTLIWRLGRYSWCPGAGADRDTAVYLEFRDVRYSNA